MSSVIRNNKNHLIRPFRSILSGLYDNDSLEGDFFNSASLPAVNVKETADHFEIQLAAPGMKKEDFSVNLEHGTLNISAETEDKKEESEKNYTRKEFSYTSFNRSFTLPDHLDENDISAKYREGVLSIVLAKKEESKAKFPKAISIN